ncbi:30S ribosome-binding factor [Spirochaetota bacterium]|nr:30S ribosome-binding factor [Spirochaetota bacterium]
MPHAFRRSRLEKQLAQRLSEIIIFEIDDIHLKDEIISITRVEVTKDFFKASVYFTLLNHNNKNRVIKALYRALPYTYSLLIKRIRIRKLPELKFFYDQTTDLERETSEHTFRMQKTRQAIEQTADLRAELTAAAGDFADPSIADVTHKHSAKPLLPDTDEESTAETSKKSPPFNPASNKDDL